MVKIILVKKSGELENSVIKKEGIEDLCKKCGYKNQDNFKLHINWTVTIEKTTYNIELYGKEVGRANFENKYDFPPPVDTVLFFGTCLLLNRNKDGKVCDLDIMDWEKVYEYLFGGFEDLAATAAEDENEEDELEHIPDSQKTKEGYLKDGFVVDDPNDSSSKDSDESYDEDDNISELAEEEYEYDEE